MNFLPKIHIKWKRVLINFNSRRPTGISDTLAIMGEKHSATIPQPQHTLARLRMILFWFRCVHSRRLPCLIVFVAMENTLTHTHTHTGERKHKYSRTAGHVGTSCRKVSLLKNLRKNP